MCRLFYDQVEEREMLYSRVTQEVNSYLESLLKDDLCAEAGSGVFSFGICAESAVSYDCTASFEFIV